MKKAEQIWNAAKELLDDEQMAAVNKDTARSSDKTKKAYAVVAAYITDNIERPITLKSLVEASMVMRGVATALIDNLTKIGSMVPDEDKAKFYQMTDMNLQFVRETLVEAEQANNRNMP